MPAYADLMSTIALLLAAVGVGWHLAKRLGERPDLVVTGREVVRFEVHPNLVWREHDRVSTTRSYSITVRNFGRSPVTVTQVGWQVLDPEALVDLAMNYRVDEDGPWSSGGPVIPHRIESFDEATWTVSEDFMKRFYASARARAAVRFSAPAISPPLRPWRRGVANRSLVGDWIELERIGRFTQGRPA